MGILRADRITGLGGANAIKGSVEFTGDGSSSTSRGVSLNIHSGDTDKTDLDFGTGNFTFEAWIYPFNGISFNCVYSQAWGLQIYSDTVNNRLVLYANDSDNSSSYIIGGAQSANGTILPDRWNHIAVVRDGTSFTMYTNGTGASPSTGISAAIASSNADYTVGIFNSLGATEDLGSYFGFAGYISNLRIRTGAQYTSNFTPPAHELEKTSDTVLLCCQSSADSTKEETGKNIVPTSKNLNHKLPAASKFTPNTPIIGTTAGFSTTTDVGSQYGTTFNGFGNFATSTYMVPPGGNTPERNRGRGIFHGGYVGPSPGNSYNAQLAAVNIQNTGSFYIFGDLTQARYTTTTVGSSTRSIFAGGAIATPSPFASVNTMDFVTIANSSNATDFGDTTSTGFAKSAVSSGTRGVITGGRPYTPSAGNALNTLDLVTIATTGNATDFGDLTAGGRFTMPNTAMSPTRGLFAGGKFNSPSDYVNNIESITIATTGDTTDFGDLLVKGGRSSGNCSSNTRGVFSLSNYPSSDSITLEFVTIASTGNATDFGDHATATTTKGALSDTISGLFYGGFSPAITGTYQNTVDQITIATTGNAVDWGDIQLSTGSGRGAYASGISDSHGGLS